MILSEKREGNKGYLIRVPSGRGESASSQASHVVVLSPSSIILHGGGFLQLLPFTTCERQHCISVSTWAENQTRSEISISQQTFSRVKLQHLFTSLEDNNSVRRLALSGW